MSMPKLNDYELLEIIGSGSYSVVHRAKHKVKIHQNVYFMWAKKKQIINNRIMTINRKTMTKSFPFISNFLFIAGDKTILCYKMRGKGESIENFHRQSAARN